MDTPQAQAPSNPYGPSPLRRPASIRRTTTLDTDWPEGIGKPMRMRGRGRDLFTQAQGGGTRVVADDFTEIVANPLREIMTIATVRGQDAAQAMVGHRGGGHLRSLIAELLPHEHVGTTAMHLLLDDFSGASLVAGWAWSRWHGDWMQKIREEYEANPENRAAMVRKMEGICTGFAPGSTALNPDGTSVQTIQSATLVPPLPHPDDPLSWHPLNQQEGVGMRRARRTDVWFEDGKIGIDVGFQDSATSPDGSVNRVAIHEYQLSATADAETLELISIEVDPRVLPYRECPGASPRAKYMEGASLKGFRLDVLEKLPGALGCTHLNDVLRSMADIPNLAAALRTELAKG